MNKFKVGDKVTTVGGLTEDNTGIAYNELLDIYNRNINLEVEEYNYDDGDVYCVDNSKELGYYFKENQLELIEEVKGDVKMNKVDVKIKLLRECTKVPTYAHDTDAGVDLQSAIDITLEPQARGTIIPTGIAIALPPRYEAQVRAKSGNSCKTTLRISNSVGTVDAGFRAEIGVIVDNLSDEPLHIAKGKGIAQLILKEQPMFNFIEVDELDTTERGEGGYGSSNRGI